jgi:hypothetical protein
MNSRAKTSCGKSRNPREVELGVLLGGYPADNLAPKDFAHIKQQQLCGSKERHGIRRVLIVRNCKGEVK